MKSTELRHAEECIRKAQVMLGSGWSHISEDLRWGLVSANILALLDAQDESIDPARIVARTRKIMTIAQKLLGLCDGILEMSDEG